MPSPTQKRTDKQFGFDYRIVEYEKVHNTTDEEFNQLVAAVDPKPGQIILAGMDGYGSVTKWLLKKNMKEKT